MPVRDSSAESHIINKASGLNLNVGETIVEYIRNHPWCTRRQVAAGTGILTSTVSGRVTDLLNKGKLVESGKKDECPISGRNVYSLKVPDSKPTQGKLL